MTILPAIFNHLWQSTAFAAMAGLLTLALRENRAVSTPRCMACNLH